MLPVISELGKEPVRGEEVQLLQPCSAAITGSRVILGMPSHPGPDRIKNDIAAQLQQEGVLLDHNGFETSLKDMPCPCVAPIEFLRVDSVQLPHALREVSIRCLDQEVRFLDTMSRFEQIVQRFFTCVKRLPSAEICEISGKILLA